MKVLVIGGSGMIGKPVTKVLVDSGFSVTVASRHGTHTRGSDDLERLELDITDPKSLSGKFESFDIIHISLPSGPAFEDCFRVEVGGTANIVAEAKKAGIKRISYLSGASDMRVDHPFPPARAKFQAEENIKNSGIPFTIWRASWFMESLARLDRFGIIGIPGKGDNRAHWLAGTDFGKMIARGYDTDAVLGKTLYAFGPEEIDLLQAAKTFRDICHPGKPILKAPIPLLSFLTKASFQNEAWFGIQMLKFLREEPEFGDPSEAIDLAGKAETTLSQYCRSDAFAGH